MRQLTFGLVLAGLCFGVLAPPAAAQVYRCKGEGGTPVYSQRPCGNDAQQVKLQGTKAPTVTQEDQRARQQVFQSADKNTAALQERTCVTNAEGDVYRPSNARIAEYQRQIEQLNRQISLANNNLAGATYESGLRQQIASLQQSISTERVSADQLAVAGRQRCAELRQRAVEEIERRYADPDKPAKD